MRSIRRDLLTRLLAGVGLVLVLAGAGVTLAVARALESQFDRNLSERVRGLASILFQVEQRVDFQFSEQLMPEYDVGEQPAYFELRFVEGDLLERSPSLGEDDLVTPRPPASAPEHWSAPLPDGREGRYVAQIVQVHHVYPEEGPQRPEARRVVVVVARGTEELVSAERRVIAIAVLSILVLIALVAVVTRLAVERGLAPARRFAADLDSLQVEDLPARFEPGELPAELTPIARKTGALMDRVRAALARERRTTADIAHELRTPLGEILTVSEVALRANGSASASPALATVRDVAGRMGRSVTTLLKLSRLEMGAERFTREPVVLGALLDELLTSLSASLRARRLELVRAVPADARVEADEGVLRIVLSNLLANAAHYAPEGTTIVVRVEAGSSWRLSIENDSADLRLEDLASLTEPFWRKDGARADRERSGLGLALSRALAERAELRLTFTLEGRRFRATLSAI